MIFVAQILRYSFYLVAVSTLLRVYIFTSGWGALRSVSLLITGKVLRLGNGKPCVM